jgi:uncharacterized membrane protein
MKPGDLSESNLVKPRDNSKFLSVLIHALAVISGMIVFSIIFFIYLSTEYYWSRNVWISLISLGLILFATFLAIGAVFGFTWNKGGWKLGLSLGILPLIFSGVLLLGAWWNEGRPTFYAISQKIIWTLPELLGGCIGAYFGAKYKQKRLTTG